MTLSVGTQLGPFEITGQIGAGGMGEVYRATDTKLGRDVAIKTLPAALAEDKDRLARFEREAKLLASLNHAHIASVYSLDEHDGTLYIAMELVEGATLEEKLKGGALPVDDALQFGLQIALALEAAHGKGVVHRDLKPANIMITPDGVVKVLDFGLAKAFSGDPTAVSAAHSPALSVAMTQQGLILGTAGYMSPEQASGQATDQRADIWAFGVVVYEMLTGMPMFSGESVPHVLADVLRTEPDWQRLPKDLHWRVRQLLERCLTKKPRNRLHSIADARVDIEAALSDPDGGSGLVRAAPRQQISLVARIAPPALAGFIGIAVASLIAWQLWPVPVVDRFVHPVPLATGVDSADDSEAIDHVGTIDLSRDGRTIAYSQGRKLYVRKLDEIEAVQILEVEGPNIFDVILSPDGDWIGYLERQPAERERGALPSLKYWLKRVPIDGGEPEELVELSGTVYSSLHWALDGSISYALQDGLWRFMPGEAPSLWIAAQEDEAIVSQEQISDDLVLFTSANLAQQRSLADQDIDASDYSQVVVQSLSTGVRTPLVDRAWNGKYLPSGHLIYRIGATLYGTTFDIDSLDVGVDHRQLEQQISVNDTYGVLSVAEDGTLIYLKDREDEINLGAAPQQRSFVWVDPASGDESPLNLVGNFLEFGVSPDGRRVAVTVADTNGEVDIWRFDLSRPQLERIRQTPSVREGWPVWIDNERIVYFALDTSDGFASISTAFRRVSADRPSLQEETLHEPDSTGALGTASLTSSGTELLFGRRFFFQFGDRPRQVSALSLDPSADGEYAVRTLEGLLPEATGVRIAPNGEHVLYASSSRTDLPGIYIDSYPEPGQLQLISDQDSGIQPVWSPTGERIYYRRLSDGAFMTLPMSTTSEFESPVVAFPNQGYASTLGTYLAPDGRFLLLKDEVQEPEPESPIAYDQIVIVKHFDQYLRESLARD